MRWSKTLVEFPSIVKHSSPSFVKNIYLVKFEITCVTPSKRCSSKSVNKCKRKGGF